MSNNLKEIRNYKTKEGLIPFNKWLSNLKDKSIKARISTRIDRIVMGNLGDSKPVGEGVSELRFTFGNGFRVYFAQDGKTIVILLCGGTKKTQPSDIEQAKKYWLDYKRRKKDEQNK